MPMLIGSKYSAGDTQEDQTQGPQNSKVVCKKRLFVYLQFDEWENVIYVIENYQLQICISTKYLSHL